jgi:predicted dienelactone hydrolase
MLASMTYDPFRRGDHPVGVRTVTLDDAARGHRLVAEVWYPADPGHAGADLDPARRDRYPLFPGYPEVWQAAVRDAAPAAGRLPLAIFSHGYAGHRRQSTFFATHLASHGWAVASVDHTGNTFVDLAMSGGASADGWARSMEGRPRDVRFLIDAAADGRLGLADVDTTRVAMTGHSFGGWTSFRTVADEPRLASVLALAPAIGFEALRAAIDLAWRRPVPVLIIAADRDSIVPLAGLETVFDELPSPATFVTLSNSDHMHFADAARQIHELFRSMPVKLVPLATPIPPFDTLTPARSGIEVTDGLGLAHLDATIRGRPEAAAFLAGDIVAALAARDIAVAVRRR